jgi:mono/diheme cytochrome c family protein
LLRALTGVCLLLAGASAPDAAHGDAVRRGEYLLRAGGCVACHTDSKGGGAFLAGGRALKTDFGIFYGPNLTPDAIYGLGRWTEADFLRAVRHGIRPDGKQYYPSFPYPSFTHIQDEDLRALWAYLRTVPPIARPNTPHELKFPFRWRFLVQLWKLLYFRPGPLQADPTSPSQVARGRYLSEALGHCGECHTPRTFLGGLKKGMNLAGSAAGPEGEAIPNLTPDPATGLGDWTLSDITELLASGMTRDGDFVGGSMGEVVENSTRHLTAADRLAIAAYLKSIPAVRSEVARKKRGGRKAPNSEW